MANEQINVVSPQGEVGTIPAEQVQDAMQAGYSQATPEQIAGAQRELKYGTTEQQIKTGLEGAAASLTGGLSTGVERAFGVKSEDILGRREENPVSHAVGEIGGLAAGMALGTGEAAIIERAGAGAGKAVGKLLGESAVKATAKDALKAQLFESAQTSALGRVGSQAAKAAVEGAMMQSGDEVSKMMASDPEQTIETAMAHIGMSGLLGAGLGTGLGSVSELWALKSHPKLTDAIDKIKGMVGEQAPAMAMALGSAMLGHGALSGYGTGALIKYLGKKMLPDLPHTLMKVISSEMPSSGEALAAAAQLIGSARKGEMLMNKAVSSVFNEDSYEHKPADAKQIEKLKKRVDELAENSDSAMNIGGQIGHYMPEHGTSAAYIGSKNAQYLASLRPNTTPLGPLDSKQTPDSHAEARYNQALQIAEQPLSLLKSVKEGSLTLGQVQDLKTLYPALYARISDKMNNGIVEAKAANKAIPYSTRLGMGMFLGQPLDSTMTPASIQASQAFSAVGPSGGAQNQPQQVRQSNKASKMPGLSSTTEQAREAKRAGGH